MRRQPAKTAEGHRIAARCSHYPAIMRATVTKCHLAGCVAIHDLIDVASASAGMDGFAAAGGFRRWGFRIRL
jgi:hypothetical protein